MVHDCHVPCVCVCVCPADQNNTTHTAFTQKTRIMGVVYNASNNEYVRTNTLVKGAVVSIDATPFRQFLEKKYNVLVGKKKEGEEPLRSENPSDRSKKR